MEGVCGDCLHFRPDEDLCVIGDENPCFWSYKTLEELGNIDLTIPLRGALVRK